MNDKFQERINGSTPHGGSYLVAYFRDATGSPCVKEKAKTIEIVEYASDDSPLFRTYGSCR